MYDGYDGSIGILCEAHWRAYAHTQKACRWYRGRLHLTRHRVTWELCIVSIVIELYNVNNICWQHKLRESQWLNIFSRVVLVSYNKTHWNALTNDVATSISGGVRQTPELS